MNTAQEGCGPNPRTYSKAEYAELSVKFAALEAENAKLRAELERRESDGWKLVPVEPTPEMVSAAEEAYMPFGDMDIALRMAILAAPSAPKADDPVKQMLLEALEALSKSAPSACCVDFHHRPCDYHGADKPCPALDRYEAARLAARAAIAAARQGE